MLFQSDVDSAIALIEEGKDLTDAKPADGLQADDMVMRCVTNKVGRLAVVVTAEILDDRIERSVVVVELALQPSGLGQRVNLGDIRGLIAEEGKCFTCFCKNRKRYPVLVTYL